MTEETAKDLESTAEPSVNKRRRWVRRTVGGILILPCILILILASAPVFITAESVRERAEQELSEALGVPVQVGKIKYSLLSGGQIDGITIGAPEGYEEPIVKLGEIKLGYDFSGLLTKKIKLTQFLVRSPVITLEKRKGQFNFEKLLSGLKTKKSEKKAKQSEPMDRSQPLSPITFILERFDIENVSFNVVGEGPNISLDGMSLRLGASIDQSKLELQNRILFKNSRLRARLPQDDGDRHISGLINLTWTSTLSAQASKGLTIDEFSSELRNGIQELQVQRVSSNNTKIDEAPPFNVAFDIGAFVSASQNRFAIPVLKARLGEEQIADASLSITGLHGFLAEILKPNLIAKMENQIGLLSKEKSGRMALNLRGFRLPLESLEPFAKMFVSNPRLRGEIRAEAIECSGTAAELIDVEPGSLGGRLVLEDVSVQLPARKLSLELAEGMIGFGNQANKNEFNLPVNGLVKLQGLGLDKNSVSSAQLSLDGGLQSLKYPKTGRTEFDLSLAMKGLVSPQGRLPELKLKASITGEDLLSTNRSELSDIQILAHLQVPKFVSRTGTQTISISELSSRFEANLGRALPYSSEAIQWKLTSELGKLKLGKGSLSGKQLKIALKGKTEDPRSGTLIAPSVNARLSADEIIQKNVRLRAMALRALIRTKELDIFADSPKGRLPRVVTASIAYDAPKILVNHPQTGKLITHARFFTKLTARPQSDRLKVEQVHLDFDEYLRMRSQGTVSRMTSSKPKLAFSVKVLPIKLKTLIARAPPVIQGKLQGLEAGGQVSLSTDIAGAWDLTRKPALNDLLLNINSRLDVDSVFAVAPSAKAQASGFNGTIVASVSKNRIGLEVRSKVDAIKKSLPEESVELNDLKLYLDAGFNDEVWSVNTSVNLAGVKGSGKKFGQGRALSSTLELTYPKYGDLKLHDLSIDFPSAGVTASMKGRLERRQFGVLRPQMSIQSRLDFDLLKRFVPELKFLSGRTKAVMSVKSETDTELGFAGELEFDGFSVEKENLKVSRIQGRMPVRQSLRLPSPKPSQHSLTIGGLGDDFERRVQALLDEVKDKGQIVVNKSNILVEAPRTADYEAMRNFYSADASRIRIDQVKSGDNVMDNLSLDASYQSGVFQIDRLAFQIWEGDVFGDMAFQLGGEDDMRMRMRMTATDLNMDLLTAKKVGSELSKGLARNDYLFSGVSDIKMDIGEQVINGTVDISKLSIPLVIRLVDFKDPDGQDESLQEVKLPLKIGQGVYTVLMGERMTGMKVWIKQNLLNSSFVWDRPWIGTIRAHELGLDSALDWLGLDFLIENEIPNPVPLVARVLQLVSRKVSQGQVNLTLADTVKDIRRKNLAEVWANPVWANLRTKLKPLAGRVVID